MWRSSAKSMGYVGNYYNGKLLTIVFVDGMPKGMKQGLEGGGVNVRKMKAEDMRETTEYA